jgi:hypothetical protein
MLYFELSKTKKMKELFNIIVNGVKHQGYFNTPLDALKWVKFGLLEGNVKNLTGAKILIKKVN